MTSPRPTALRSMLRGAASILDGIASIAGSFGPPRRSPRVRAVLRDLELRRTTGEDPWLVPMGTGGPDRPWPWPASPTRRRKEIRPRSSSDSHDPVD